MKKEKVLYYYRGQENSVWRLEPSIMRYDDLGIFEVGESEYYKYIRKNSILFKNIKINH